MRIIKGSGHTDKEQKRGVGFKLHNKVNVYMRQVASSNNGWIYLHSTNAYRTCQEATIAAAQGKSEHLEFIAWKG